MPEAMRGREHTLNAVRISLKKKSLADYERIVGRDAIDEILSLAADLKGLRVLHLNATASGGGVAELLSSLVPLLVSAGLAAEWNTLPQHAEFFEVTKRFHNALQGMPYVPTEEDVSAYLDHDRLSAEALTASYDVVVTHDPQPVAFRHFAGRRGAKWVWRCHIDTSAPSADAWDLLRPFVEEYDAAVFTLRAFVPPGLGLGQERLFFIPPAIDPLSSKNRHLPESLCEEVVSEFGIDVRHPLLTQVSRFDPWKDPLGVIGIYRRLKERFPALQLALVAFMAQDDPEAWRVYASVESETAGDPDAYVFTNLDGVGSLEVNAFQRVSDVVVQKSIREGFGLVVSEAIWKGTPVVAGDTGGISLQMSDGVGGYLADDQDDYAERISALLNDRSLATAVAAAGRERVREHFLVTRLLADELRMLRELVL
ncbi:MAG TPA: glycosyltransferase [Coriobacteriia bacterium]|jgi:trehalose synthase